MEAATHPRRLIEVDLPISAISRESKGSRSVHQGHITAIHIWWARKPLPPCRAAALAATLLDPVDSTCPPRFRSEAARILSQLYALDCSADDHLRLRRALLQFVADFSSWKTAKEPRFLKAARSLAAAAHEVVFGPERQLLADPFCGGGSVPLEGLRLGAAAYASDLNPVAALISKITLEYVQRLGEKLFGEVERWGEFIAIRAEQRLRSFYPNVDGKTSVASVSFRRIRCDGPGCGAEVVLTSKFHLARRGAKTLGLRLDGWNGHEPRFGIYEGALSSFPEPTVRRGAATCLRCGFTMPVERVREQLTAQHGGAANALLVGVATADEKGLRSFRPPDPADHDALERAKLELAKLETRTIGALPLLPEEPLPPIGTLGFRVQRYGMVRWRDIFTPRQLLTLTTLVEAIQEVLPEDREPDGLGVAVRSCLALAVDRMCDYQNTGCSWNPSGSALPHLFTRQALPIIWDFGEANPLLDSSGGWRGCVRHVLHGLRNARVGEHEADVGFASASHHPLPTDCAHLLITDPPYYDAIPYADLSDSFYVWLRRMLSSDHPSLFATALVPRENECIVNRVAGKDGAYYRRVMTEALSEARRVTRPDGVGVVVFAHKSTSGWEDLLAAMLDAGWIITASWPIDTENAGRLRARNSAVLGSSIHLVCRPREHPDGRLITDTVGDWRDILRELPVRLHAWMPRLARDGVVGADAIFACLGPALELFSRFARVEKVSGERVTLAEYLEHVWAAVSREALSMIFDAADATGLEPDARVTAMWLWTLSAPSADAGEVGDEEEDPGEVEAEATVSSDFELEFDPARKIAQGLGARLEELTDVVEINGQTARLRNVAERKSLLMPSLGVAPTKPRRKKGKQAELFDVATLGPDSASTAMVEPPTPGRTTLDRVHQAMLLFGTGRAEALRRFIVEDGVGRAPEFWRLAQALSVLYPAGCDEKRWVDGTLSRKKVLGFG
ncbi:MAG: DUF1156 domain-containing protein [Deltaproteobacteria bacterium]|nr:DUF1156 domain-containing protein [Deltaproteobacteria bacterium]